MTEDALLTKTGASVLTRLTMKEKEVITLLGEGMVNRDIAVQLGTSEQVIKNVLRLIYWKTGMDNRLTLVLFCFHHGILACPCPARRHLVRKENLEIGAPHPTRPRSVAARAPA